MVEVKIKQMTNVMLSMSEDDAAKLRTLLGATVLWGQGPLGRMAEELYDALGDCGVDEFSSQLRYCPLNDMFVETK